MNSVHIEAGRESVSDLVIMPGDPLRAKYIAEKFLTDYSLINEVRNMLGYTGYYKGVRVTVLGSGMGCPSMGIYSYELAKFYDVKKIIRVGSGGALDEKVKIRDLVVATSSRSLSTFPLSFGGDESKEMLATPALIEAIKKSTTSERIHFGPILTSETFDPYCGLDHVKDKIDFDGVLSSEMEAFALYYIGKITGVEVATIMTIVDSKFTPDLALTPEERESSLDEMIILALEAIIK